MQTKYNALENRSKELLLSQGSAVSGASIALSGLGNRLELLVEQLITSYNISEQDLEVSFSLGRVLMMLLMWVQEDEAATHNLLTIRLLLLLQRSVFISCSIHQNDKCFCQSYTSPIWRCARHTINCRRRFLQFILITLPHPISICKARLMCIHLSCFIAVNICVCSHPIHRSIYRLSRFDIRLRMARTNDGTQFEFNHAKHILLCWQHL